jgi:NADH:ubiquinone oxidoreductase subunit 5 (subunit L)/multisubunit Na+/H+ antiporter MnhA subunit
MEGPTPVSALLHAATMVAVGVFFFLRISCIFFLVRGFLVIVLFLSVLTCFFCSLMALFQSDIKRIIAYSTCSQLGIMLAAVSLFYFSVAFFHLFTHAFFKALLFLGSGFIIHFFLDEQDIRRMGGILNFFILGYLFFFFGSLALVGFPFLSGFYSKDIIVELSFLYFFLDSFFVGFFVGLSSMFSLLYSFRLIWLAFFGFPNFWFLVLGKFFHSNWFMLISCVILFFSSCFFGFVFYDLFLGLGSIFWFSSFVGFEFYYYFFDLSFVSLFLQNSVFFFLVFGFIFGFLFNVFVFPHFFFIGEFFWSFYSFFCGRFYFDYVYNFFVDFVFKCFVFFVFDVDKGFLEFFGPYGVNYALSKISEFFICLQSGHLFHYFFLFILGIIFLLVLFFFTFFYVTFVFGFFCLIFPFLVYWFFCLLC